jgi:uncharacterized protein (DUF2147 family)
MSARSILRAAFAASALIAVGVAPAAADPTGLWLDKDGWTIRIQACGPDLCAVVASVKPPLDPATGQPQTDKNNSDAAKRSRPLIGVEVLSGMRPNGARKWTGQLYDPDRGVTLGGNLLELDQDTIRIEGCLLMLCGGEDLHRLK